ncbi:MAG TPA: 50S ribosomal protein L17 [Treponemataceae bacterium]|jgi:large subunit ribosomal protein L17|nr:50S ribosomal protein L17 [Treponema sp.]OQB04798.1 MAG: 50S ribosomal protein L17 [Spirochaetes bacterium ADurb.Bin215]HOF85448.1 50S ribosomal protein L17 [Treponemataceae bacterium]HOS35021.1 50S ribosomal protein L17 [Treponemataceae bacterium]HOU37690.1 50S ribosomal protein L17 [Treponemataceae bacterium]
MKHKNGFNPLSRTASHRRAMHRNMVTSLFKYERVTTTKAKALEVRRTAEKLITRSKVDTVHNRRQAAKYVQDKAILAKLFTEIGPRMKDRAGGYTRVLKLGFREGDAAEVAILELVDYKLEVEGDKGEKKAKKAPAKAAEEKKPATKKPDADKKPAVKKPAAKKTAEDKAPAEKKAPAAKKPAAKKADGESKAAEQKDAEAPAEKASGSTEE